MVMPLRAPVRSIHDAFDEVLIRTKTCLLGGAWHPPRVVLAVVYVGDNRDVAEPELILLPLYYGLRIRYREAFSPRRHGHREPRDGFLPRRHGVTEKNLFFGLWVLCDVCASVVI